MATGPKATDYKPRFDFRLYADLDEPTTGTLKELLAEINHEYKTSATEVELKSLGRTLKFIARFTSHKFTSLNESLPLQELKTIKLLHVTNDESMGQMFRWLETPGSGEKPSFEVRTTGETTRNKDMVKVLNDLLHSLGLGISKERLQHIERSLLTPTKLLQSIQNENLSILAPFNAIPKNDDGSTIRALKFLTESIRSYGGRKLKSKVPLHEALYTYLRSLPFFHFVGEYKAILQEARIATPAHPIKRELRTFCEDLSHRFGEPIGPATPVTSIDQFGLFVEENFTALAKLVKATIELEIRKDKLPDVIPLASKILHSHVFHVWGGTPLNATNLSAADCVAALCAVRHQQKVKTPYVPFWIGQGSKDRNRNRLLSHLKPERPIQDLYIEDYIPQGASQLLYDRFRQFHAVIEGRTVLHQSWAEFHMARLDGYIRSLQFTDVDCIDAAANDLNHYCELMAIQAVRRLNDQ